MLNYTKTLLNGMLAADLEHVHMTHPALGDGEPFGAVPQEVDLPLCVAPSVSASPPQWDGCQTLTAHVWNTNHKQKAVSVCVGEFAWIGKDELSIHTVQLVFV